MMSFNSVIDSESSGSTSAAIGEAILAPASIARISVNADLPAASIFAHGQTGVDIVSASRKVTKPRTVRKAHLNPAGMMGKHNKKDAAAKDKTINPLTREETQIMLDKAEKDLAHYYPLFLCAARTGIREGSLRLSKGPISISPTG